MAKNIIDIREESYATLNKIKGIGLIGGRLVKTKEDSVNLAIEIIDKIISKNVLTEFELGNVLKD